MPQTFPAPHLLLHDFLLPAEHAALLTWTLDNETRFTPAGVAGNVIDPTRRSCAKLNDLGPTRDVLTTRIHAAYPGWLQQLRVSPFNLAHLELQIVAYPDQAHFAFHMDAALGTDKPARNRRLTAVYYFHHEPRRFTGGDIRLYPLGAGPRSQPTVAIPPAQNTLLVFPSWVGHDVTAVHCPTQNFADSCFAVNCWLHQPA